MTDPLLSVQGLSVNFRTPHGFVHALRNVDMQASAGEVIGIVGESGCGKSTLASAIANLLPGNAGIAAGRIRFRDNDVLRLDADAQRRLRGREIAMVFQDPMTAFSPVLTIGQQLIEFQHQMTGIGKAEKRQRAEAMLVRVGISDARLRLDGFPHEMSGGMRQRVAIAAALLMNPSLLIADEPTTALDVTLEAQIIHLLRALRRDYNGAIVIVSHQLGVIAELCDRVYVMYAGEVVELAPIDDIFHRPRHPYTQALLDCDPARLNQRGAVLPTIAGEIPDLTALPDGCVFAPRCSFADDRCRVPQVLTYVSDAHAARCHRVQP